MLRWKKLHGAFNISNRTQPGQRVSQLCLKSEKVPWNGDLSILGLFSGEQPIPTQYTAPCSSVILNGSSSEPSVTVRHGSDPGHAQLTMAHGGSDRPNSSPKPWRVGASLSSSMLPCLPRSSKRRRITCYRGDQVARTPRKKSHNLLSSLYGLGRL